MPHPPVYVPDAKGLDNPPLFRQGSKPYIMRGFVITVAQGSHSKRLQAGDEALSLLTHHFGTGPGFSKQEIENAAGVEFVRIGVESDNYQPSTLAQGLLTELARGAAYEHGKAKAGDIQKFIPVETSAYDVDTQEKMLQLIVPFIHHHFPEEGKGTFGVHYEEHTPSHSWGHEDISKMIADLVPEGFKVDLVHPERMIVVVTAGRLFTAAVVGDWEKLHHYNLHALTTEEPSHIV